MLELLWPRLATREPLATLPGGTLNATAEVRGYATDLLTRQAGDYDALDTKAATVIGAVLVFVGLVFPQVHPHHLGQWLVFAGLLGLLVYTMATAIMGYRVSRLRMPWTPDTAVFAMRAVPADADAALAYGALDAYLANKPMVDRKAKFVRLSIYAVGPVAALVVALFFTGALG